MKPIDLSPEKEVVNLADAANDDGDSVHSEISLEVLENIESPTIETEFSHSSLQFDSSIAQTQRSETSILKEQTLYHSLKDMYTCRDGSNDTLPYEICGQLKGISTFHYPTTLKLKDRLTIKRMVFVDFASLKDPSQITYKYQTLIASAHGNKTKGKVFLSMCALGHPAYIEGRYILLQIFETLCDKPRLDYLVLDRVNLGIPAKILQQHSINQFYIAPEYHFTREQYEVLTQRRHLELKRLGLFYDATKAKPKDTQNPHGWEKRKKINQNPDGSYILTDKLKENKDTAIKCWQPIKGLNGCAAVLSISDSEGDSLSRTDSVTSSRNLRSKNQTVTFGETTTTTINNTKQVGTYNKGKLNLKKTKTNPTLHSRSSKRVASTSGSTEQYQDQYSNFNDADEFANDEDNTVYIPNKRITGRNKTVDYDSLTRNEMENMLNNQNQLLTAEFQNLRRAFPSRDDIVELRCHMNNQLKSDELFRTQYLNNQSSNQSDWLGKIQQVNDFQSNLTTKQESKDFSNTIINELSNKVHSSNKDVIDHADLTRRFLSSEIANHTSQLSKEVVVLKGLVEQTIENQKDRDHRMQIENLNSLLHNKDGDRKERESERKLLMDVVKELNNNSRTYEMQSRVPLYPNQDIYQRWHPEVGYNFQRDDRLNFQRDDRFNFQRDDRFNFQREDRFNSNKDDRFNSKREDGYSSQRDERFEPSPSHNNWE